MTTRIFEFNRWAYRVCNLRTWERLEQMDGMEVTVSGPPQRIHVEMLAVGERYPEPWASSDPVLMNEVLAVFPDGHRMTVLVFNSELSPVPPVEEPTDQ